MKYEFLMYLQSYISPEKHTPNVSIEMIVLKTTQRLLTFVGLQFKDSNPSWYKWYRVFCFAIMVSLLQPMVRSPTARAYNNNCS